MKLYKLAIIDSLLAMIELLLIRYDYSLGLSNGKKALGLVIKLILGPIVK